MSEPADETHNRKGRPVSRRYTFQKDHPQTTTHLIMEHSEPQVPVLFGPQIPRKDREDTRERYCRALLTLFLPWRTAYDLCDIDQTWENALKVRQSRIAPHSWKIIENIQLLHECRKDRNEHLLQVIAESQTENDVVDPELLPDFEGHRLSRTIANLKPFERTKAYRYTSDANNVQYAVWYLRLRNNDFRSIGASLFALSN